MRAALVLGLLLLAGCSEPAGPEPPWHGRDLSDWKQFPAPGLKPCQVVELDYRFSATTNLTWDWVSVDRISIEFVLHTHAGDDVVELVNVTTDQHAGTFQAQAGQVYSIVWTNTSPETADLWYDLLPWHTGFTSAAPPTRSSPEATPM